jgi:hypothetical protein
MFFLFLRFLPMVAMAEVKQLVPHMASPTGHPEKQSHAHA